MLFKDKLKNWSLTWKFSLVFIGLVLIPTMILASIAIFQMNSIVTNQANEATNRILNTLEDRLNSVIENIESTSTYMIFSNDFRSTMLLPETNQNKNRFDELTESINGFMTFHLLSKDYINSVTIEGNNGYSLSVGEPVSANESKWRELAQQKKGKIVWSSTYPIIGAWHGNEDALSLFRVINDINNINQPIGFVTIRLNQDGLNQLLTAALPKEKGTAFITNQKGIVITHSNPGFVGKQHPDWKSFRKFTESATKNSFKYTRDGTDYLVNFRKLENTNWYLFTMVKEKEVLSDLLGLRVLMFSTGLALLVLGVIALMIFYKNIINPIIALTKLTRRVETGDFTASIQLNMKDEIGELGNRFNQMVSRINHLIDTKYKLEIKQRESELKSLQSQINPHFLYNTLDMIRWTARIEKAFETSELIELLSQLFRLSLSKGKLWIPISQEFLHVRTYLELQKRRMGNRLSYSVFLDASIEESYILKQIVQPLVENSIVHGFTGIRNCKITVRGYLVNELIWIDVIDNGKGIDWAEFHTEPKVKEGGYALNNINERMAAAFGDDCQLQFIEHDQPGTWVRVVIPNITEEQNALNKMYKLGDLNED